ncbi:hypothetical protein ACFL1Q_00915 [Patescibacteria group bacterium]
MKLADVTIGDTFLGSGGNIFKEVTGVGELVSLIIQIAFIVAGLAILVFFILGGIGIIAGAGSNDPQKIEKGKQSATSALIGFVVVFVAYWIVQLIELWTGIKIL